MSPTEVLRLGNKWIGGQARSARLSAWPPDWAPLGDRLQTTSAQVALNLPLVALILMRNLKGPYTGILPLIYNVGTIIGCYLLPILLGCALLTVPLAGKRHLARRVCIVPLSGYVFFLLIDSFVFSIYKFHLDMFWLSFLIHDFSGLGIPLETVLAACVVLAMILVVEWKLSLLAVRWRRSQLLWLVFPVTAVLGLVSSQLIHVFAYEKGDSRITSTTPLLPSYLPLHSHKYAVKYGTRFGVNQSSGAHESAAHPAGLLHFPLAPIYCDSVAGQRSPNIVMILLESWRADTMNDQVSPRIAEFGRRNIVCREHFSSGNSTVAGIFGLFYGIQPTYWEAVKAGAEYIDNPPLIDVLQDKNYDIGVYARSNFKRHKLQETIFRGIPVNEDFAGKTADAWDREMTDKMLSFLDAHQEGNQPFFLFGFYKASHFGYFYDEEHAKFQPAHELSRTLVAGPKNPEPFLNDYRNSVFFDDNQVGRILDKLDASGLLDNTIVIISSDHAEEFNDNGADYWGHGSNFTRWQTQVPMILHLPGQKPRQINVRTSHLDIVPTLLHGYFGVTNAVSDYSDGVDLGGEVPPLRLLVQASYFNYAFIIGDDVLVSLPLGQKRYSLDDITQPPGAINVDMLQRAIPNLSRF